MEEEEKIVKTERVKRKIVLSRIKRRLLRHTRLLRVLLVTLAASFFIGLMYFVGFLLKDTKLGGYLSFGSSVLFSTQSDIESVGGRVNFLLLGKGGEGHDAPDLTDTIIFGSLSLKEKDLILVSLPRDIWVADIRAKINSAYYWGEQKKEGGGFVLAGASVEEVVGAPIFYSVLIDFAGFKDIIDAVEGVRVEVENSFTDEKYPIPGKENDRCGGDLEYLCRYETISFQKGSQEMDGETALKFVRSRNAEGDEGTDIARARRQQKIITAIKDRVISLEIIFSPKKITRLLEAVGKSVETDLSQKELAYFLKRLAIVNGNLNPLVLPEEFLINPPTSSRYDNLYVFISEDNWESVHEWIDELLI